MIVKLIDKEENPPKPLDYKLDIIFQDEIGHVKIGSYWYRYLCNQRSIDPVQTFNELIKKHIGSNLRGPFNTEARLLSDFSQAELEYLEQPERF